MNQMQIYITNIKRSSPPSCESEMKEKLYFVCVNDSDLSTTLLANAQIQEIPSIGFYSLFS